MNDANNGSDRFKTWFGDSDEEVANWIRGNGQLPLFLISIAIVVAIIIVGFFE